MTKKSFLFVLFGVSLLTNAFLAGFLLSGCFQHHRPPSPLDRAEKALEHVSPQYRADIQKIIDEHRSYLDERMEGRRQKFEEIQAILTAPTFDEGALRAALDSSQEKDVKQSIHGLLISIAKTLPDDERIRFFRESAPDGPPPMGPGGDMRK